MDFEITNGSGHISVGVSDIGSYLRYDTPLTVVWYDCHGSISKYFCLLPYNRQYRDALEQRITDNLSNNFSGKEATLYTILEPLFSLFANGRYSLRFYNSNEFFRYQSSSDNYTADHYFPLELYFTEVTDVKRIEQVKEAHKVYLESIKGNEKYYPPDLLTYTTDNVYDSYSAFYASEPQAIIDEQRVQFFKEKIGNGERPFPIIINAENSVNDSSAFYVLDGHHKLLAYQQLGVSPPVALITRLYKQDTDVDFDLELLSKVLYPWQVRHIVDNWDGKDQYLRKLLVNPASALQHIVRNGDVKEYHDNGTLKLEGYYINHLPEGMIRRWYDNGQLRSLEYYTNGKRTGTHKTWFDNGKLKSISRFDEEGQYHGPYEYYHPNGQKAGESHYEHGRDKDMIPHRSWHQNGKKSAIIRYENGKLIERINWNDWGDLLNHEVLNDAGELVNTVTPSTDRYDRAMQREYNREIRGGSSFMYYARIVVTILLSLMLLLTMLKNLMK
jgi:hypothetical protein